MARSTGPILAAGAITLFTDVVIENQPVTERFRVVVATAIAAGGLALLEQLVSEELAVGLAWIGLVTLLLVRTDPKVPSPIEAFNNWYYDRK